MNTLKKLRLIIPTSIKKRLVILSIILFTLAVIELLSLSSIYPFVDILINDNDKYSRILNSLFNINLNRNQTILISVLGILILFFLKTIFVIYVSYRNNRFIQNFTKEMLVKLLKNFFKEDYYSFIERNSGKFYRNFDAEIRNFAHFFESLIIVFSELILILTISTFLIILNPIPTLTTFIFIFISSYLVYRVPKNYIKRIGIKLRKIDVKINMILIESLNGFKEIIFFNKEKIFIKNLKKESETRVSIISSYLTLNSAPKVLIETIAIIGLIIYSLISINLIGKTDLFLNIGLLVASTFKILPSANKIVINFNNFNYFKTSVDTLYSKIILFHEVKIKTKKSGKIIFDNISFGYDSNLIIKNLYFEINKGDIFVISGKSGSGKSTILKLLTGHLKPKKGKIIIDGSEFSLSSDGYLSQDSYLFNNSIIYNITFENDTSLINQKKLKKAISLSNIEELFQNFKDESVGENGSKLSGGQKQRVCLARAIYNDSETFLLDEPTSALDIKNVQSFIYAINKLNNEGKTIIITTHSKEIINSFKNKIEIK